MVSADLVLRNGNILTMNPEQPRAESVAIVGDRIARVGSNSEIAPLVGDDTRVLDLNGKTVVPGFIDTHVHVADFGRTLEWLDLSQANSIQTLQALISEKAARISKGKWILGSGWNQQNLKEKRAPTRQELDEASQDHPIILYHQLGRTCIVNSVSLKLSGVTKLTVAPKDGTIERDENGNPTGILEGNATDLAWNAVPHPTEQETLQAAKEACNKIMEAGITSAHWIALSTPEMVIAQKLIREDDIPLRIFLVVTDEVYENLVEQTSMDNVGGVLIFSDGYLASQTAALNQSYAGSPGNKGQLLYTQEELKRLTAKVSKAKLQIIIHAMGDKAVDTTLKALQALPQPQNNRPHRIEQAALLNRQLLQCIKKLKPIITIQPKVVESEFTMWSAIEHLEERARMLFPLKTLLKHGIRVSAGSDCPMEPLNPLQGIQALVTRKAFPEERLTAEEALRLYTVEAAYATNEEADKGSINEGKLADLTLLSEDPTTAAPDKLAEIVVNLTIIGGKVCYKNLSA